LNDDKAKELALGDFKIVELLQGKELVKVVVVKGKLVNIVIK
jgi:leucyl-tRNA synthetase